MRNKEKDLERLAENLDISNTMYSYAVDRYMGISKYLLDRGIQGDFSPQGSFRTGTVVRPLRNGVETDYDLDVICTLAVDKHKTFPSEVKQSVGIALEANSIYRDKLLPEDSRCWTLEYAGVSDGIGFKLDIVPSVKESSSHVLRIMKQDVPAKYAVNTIAVTDKGENGKYSWLTSNTKGFGDWFEDINKPFSSYNYSERRENYFKNNRAHFSATATVESVDPYLVKSSLQRVVQLLKRHRDLYYHRARRDNLRPESIIITVLAAKIAVSASASLSVDALLAHVVQGISDYAVLLNGDTPNQALSYNAIEKRDGVWWVENPVDHEDNFAEFWTKETAEEFFRWIEVVKNDVVDISPINEAKYLSGLQRSFGTEFVTKKLPLFPSATTTSTITTPIKPWGQNICS